MVEEMKRLLEHYMEVKVSKRLIRLTASQLMTVAISYAETGGYEDAQAMFVDLAPTLREAIKYLQS